MFNIFENPWLFLTVAFIALVVIVFIRQGWPDKRKWWQLLIPVIVAGAAFGLNYFVETDYEKVDSLIKLGTEAVIAKDIAQLDAVISPDYHSSTHRSKEKLIAFCRVLLSKPLISKARQRYKKIIVSPPEANAQLEFIVHMEEQNPYAIGGKIMHVKMKMHFTKTSHNNWLIDSAEILAVNNQQFNWSNLR